MSKKLVALCALIMVGSFAIACGESGPRPIPADAPKWVVTPDYNTPGTLVGVGSAVSSGDAASDYAAAEEGAVDDLLKQISVKVQSIYDEQVRESRVGNKSTTSVETYSNVTTTAKGEIPSIRNVNKWLDKDNRRYYVRVQVSNQRLASALTTKLNEEVSQLSAQNRRAEANISARKYLDAVAPLQKVAAKVNYAIMLNAQIIGLGYKGSDGLKALLDSVAKTQDMITANAQFDVQVQKAFNGTSAASKITEMITKMGYKRQAQGRCTVILMGDIHYADENAGGGNDLRRATYNASIAIVGKSGFHVTVPIKDKDGNAPVAVAFASSGKSDTDLKREVTEEALPIIAKILADRLTYQ